MAYFNNRDEYAVVNGTTDGDSIYNSTGADHATINGAEGDDSIHNWGEEILIRPGAGSNLVRIYGNNYMEFNLDESDGLTAIGNELEYDATVDRYVGVGSATLEVDDNAGDVSIWLNGWDGKSYSGIAVLDADDARGSVILAGNDLENQIYGGENNSSMWGGAGSENDTMHGGDGRNMYFYLYGNGNDVVTDANDDDVINLLNIGLEEINFNDIEMDNNSIKIGMNDGGSIKVNGRADVIFQLNNGVGFKADRSTGGWRLS